MKKSIKFLAIFLPFVLLQNNVKAQDTSPDAFIDNGANIITPTTFTGNVGIGLPTPLAKLHVNGDIKINTTNHFDFGALSYWMGHNEVLPAAVTNAKYGVGAANYLANASNGSIQLFGRAIAGSSYQILGASTVSPNLGSNAVLMEVDFNGGGTYIKSKLDVDGNISIPASASGNNNIYLGGVTSNSQNGMRLWAGLTGASSPGSIRNSIDVRTANLTDALSFRVDNGTGNTERLRIQADGKIGIGTSSPSDKLTVAGELGFSGSLGQIKANMHGINDEFEILSGDATNYGSYISLRSNVATNGAGSIALISSGASNGGKGIEFMNYNTTTSSWESKAVLTKNGKFGIGTLTPNAMLEVNGTAKVYGAMSIGTQTITTGLHTDYKLAVDGKILAKEMVIQLNDWADYVFANDYKLKSLSEVENYIQSNHHLPNIPATKAMIENGMNVSDIVTLQQEKIEELYLYIIEMNKKIDALQNQK